MSEIQKSEMHFFNHLMDIPLVNYIWDLLKSKYEEIKKYEYAVKVVDFFEGIVKDGYEKLKPYFEGPRSKIMTIDSIAVTTLEKLKEIFPFILRNPTDMKNAILSYSLDFRSIISIGPFAHSTFLWAMKFVDECLNFAFSLLDNSVDYFFPPSENEKNKPTTFFGRTYNLFEKISARLESVGKDLKEQSSMPSQWSEITTGRLVQACWAIPLVTLYEFVVYLYRMNTVL